LKFFPLDAYCDIQLYPSFHNRWAGPLYIVVAHWSKKSEPVYILLSNLQFSGIITAGTKSTLSSKFRLAMGNTTPDNFRFAQRTYTIVTQFFGRFECAIRARRIGSFEGELLHPHALAIFLILQGFRLWTTRIFLIRKARSSPHTFRHRWPHLSFWPTIGRFAT